MTDIIMPRHAGLNRTVTRDAGTITTVSTLEFYQPCTGLWVDDVVLADQGVRDEGAEILDHAIVMSPDKKTLTCTSVWGPPDTAGGR